MALPGLRSTNDMGTDGRPKNWREGIQLLAPRNGASLFALTAAMRSEMTDDPEFSWWDEKVDMLVLQTSAANASTSEETMAVDEFATRLKAGDMLLVEATGEAIRVISITSDTAFEAQRGVSNTTPANIPDNAKFLYIGSAYREGAGKATGTAHNPVKHRNYTQIFRDPIEWTRTAMKTKLRYTKDIMREDRRRALNKHSIGIERAMVLGVPYETTEAGQPLRFTGGIMSFIPSENKRTVAGAGGALDMDELMSYFPDMFAYGSGEKLAYTSLRVLQMLGEVVRKNSSYEWGGREKEYGMAVKRLYTPAGTLVLTEHPLFGQGGGFLSDGILVLDTAKLKYRYIDDTDLLKDREDRGTDGKSEEYLTECGLEVHNPECFFHLGGITSAAADS